MKPIVEISHLSKKFRIHQQRIPYLSIRDSFSSLFKNNKERFEDFYALDDLSLNVFPGESIGIIGKNGAGKSTLLKILSKITPPTSGNIILRGRIASLLEVGTGFHPELSGRENIFLNGSILGMKRKEIAQKFDEIIDFSGTEKFLDTPLKHYSSGMQLRLAFSVAAFLEPEILIIDEVLAVGDAEFQKKCMGKMEDVSKSGRTILFVSHNLGAVKQLCTKSIFLSAGKLIAEGRSEDVVNLYLNSSGKDFSKKIINDTTNSFIEFHSIELINAVENCFSIKFDEPIKMTIQFTTKQKLNNVSFGVGLTTLENIPLFTTRSMNYGTLKENTTFSVVVEIPHNIRAGSYVIALGITSGLFNYYHNGSIAQLEVLNYGTANYQDHDNGLINCQSEWTLNNSN
ncbi:MAG: ABC transporter ATP-binding protein [Bacteroidota bacterium]|nr:ABC transporter ATP-binding protein [Bacteroidota bacterium]